jgi:hypothetical protein
MCEKVWTLPSNVYYLGKGRIVNIYDDHEVLTIEEKQQEMWDWKAVQEVIKNNPDLEEKLGGQEAFTIQSRTYPLAYPWEYSEKSR